MKLVKLLMIAAISTLTVGTAISQTTDKTYKGKSERMHKTPEERAKHKAEKMAEKLSLSEAQTAQIEKIQLDYAKKEDIERETRKARRIEQSEKIKAVLTPEQAEKFEAAKKEHKGKRKHKRGKKGEKKKKAKMEGSDGLENDKG